MLLRLAILLVVLGGCRRIDPVTTGITLVDDAGQRTVLAAPATRIVSLVPSATELLFALGGGGAMVGRTRWCDFPEAALAIPSVGDGISPNVEAVMATRPDLVIIYRSSGNAEAVAKLRGLGVPVLEIALDRYADFERDTRLLAAALGRTPTGDSLVTAVGADLARATVVRDRRVSVFILAWNDPPIAIGGGSFLSEIIDRAGATNIFGDSDKPSFTVSIEAVVGRNPERILTVGADDPTFVKRPEWQVVPAVRERRFVRVEGSMFNRPSPRIGDAVRALATALDGPPR